MLEVPGMTRPALDGLRPTDVEKLRWGLYARALRPSVQADYDRQLLDLADADSPPKAGALKARRAVERERLEQARIRQLELRRHLLLDDDEDVTDAE
jgi:hypothetical protein